jgi:hypothetical protein
VVEAGINATADGWAGRGLRRLLTAAGFTGITLDARFVEADYPFLRRLLAPSLRRLAASGTVPAEVLGRWQQTLEATWNTGHHTGGGGHLHRRRPVLTAAITHTPPMRTGRGGLAARSGLQARPEGRHRAGH